MAQEISTLPEKGEFMDDGEDEGQMILSFDYWFAQYKII